MTRKRNKSKIEEKEIRRFWSKYKGNNDEDVKGKLMLHYIWLVKYALHSMNLPSNSILEDSDFLNIGILGLHEAIEKYDPKRGVKFESYALPRIKGIIKDELRKLDWLSRTARKKAHDYLAAGDEVRNKIGREATNEEIRKKLNVTQSEYYSYLSAAAAAKAYLSLSESQIIDDKDKNIIEDAPDYDNNTLKTIESEERIAFIQSILKNIGKRKRLVVTLYYYENLTFKEIGKILNVSESRICQIHSQVLRDLKIKLKEYDYA